MQLTLSLPLSISLPPKATHFADGEEEGQRLLSSFPKLPILGKKTSNGNASMGHVARVRGSREQRETFSRPSMGGGVVGKRHGKIFLPT